MFIRKALAFIRKDFLIALSYKFAFIFGLFSTLAYILTFFFIGKLFGARMIPHLEPYGGEYFPFVLLGIAFSTYLGTGLGSFAGKIRQEQMMGTLEALLVTPTKTSTIIISMALWNFIFASFDVLLYLLLGAFLFKVDLSQTNLLAALVILLLTIVSFSSLGIISAGFIMVFKRGNPITWVVSTLFELLGGVFFPITILPSWVRIISYILPITYSLRAMRLAVLKGYSLSNLSTELAVLLLFSLILLPLSIISFRYALRKAKIDGSLVHY
jgi:ABC-2 type transport system permease protein